MHIHCVQQQVHYHLHLRSLFGVTELNTWPIKHTEWCTQGSATQQFCTIWIGEVGFCTPWHQSTQTLLIVNVDTDVTITHFQLLTNGVVTCTCSVQVSHTTAKRQRPKALHPLSSSTHTTLNPQGKMAPLYRLLLLLLYLLSWNGAIQIVGIIMTPCPKNSIQKQCLFQELSRFPSTIVQNPPSHLPMRL